MIPFPVFVCCVFASIQKLTSWLGSGRIICVRDVELGVVDLLVFDVLRCAAESSLNVCHSCSKLYHIELISADSSAYSLFPVVTNGYTL